MPWDIDKGGGRIYRQPVETNPDKFVKDKEIQRIMRVIGVPKRYQQCRLDKVPDNVDYRAGLMIFVETLVERDKRGDGLLMFGSYGTGKTGASVSVLYEAIKRGCRCRFVSARDLGRIAFDFEESQKDRWADLRRYQLVVLDEMGVERENSTSHESAKIKQATEDLIRHRYDSQLMTIINTNNRPDETVSHYDDLSTILRHAYRSIQVAEVDWRGGAE